MLAAVHDWFESRPFLAHFLAPPILAPTFTIVILAAAPVYRLAQPALGLPDPPPVTREGVYAILAGTFIAVATAQWFHITYPRDPMTFSFPADAAELGGVLRRAGGTLAAAVIWPISVYSIHEIIFSPPPSS